MITVPIANSSMLSEIAYDEPTLRVTFTKGGIYSYADVPKDVWESFVSAESAGKFFLANIKGKYDDERCSV